MALLAVLWRMLCCTAAKNVAKNTKVWLFMWSVWTHMGRFQFYTWLCLSHPAAAGSILPPGEHTARYARKKNSVLVGNSGENTNVLKTSGSFSLNLIGLCYICFTIPHFVVAARTRQKPAFDIWARSLLDFNATTALKQSWH